MTPTKKQWIKFRRRDRDLMGRIVSVTGCCIMVLCDGQMYKIKRRDLTVSEGDDDCD